MCQTISDLRQSRIMLRVAITAQAEMAVMSERDADRNDGGGCGGSTSRFGAMSKGLGRCFSGFACGKGGTQITTCRADRCGFE